MHFKFNSFFATLSILLVCHRIMNAQSTTGRFLLLRPSAVSSAMGGAGVAADESPFSSYFNAAGLAFTPTVSVAGSFANPLPFFNNVRHAYLSGAVRLDDIGTIGFSSNLYWKGQHIRTASSGITIGNGEDLMDWHMKLSLAHAFSDDFAAGFGIGILRLNLAGEGAGNEHGQGSSTSVLFDGGVLYRNLFPSSTFIRGEDTPDDPFASIRDQRSHNGVSVGLSLANIGPKVTMIDAAQADPLPSTLRVAIAYSPVRTSALGIMITADAENQLSEGMGFNGLHWGAELQVFKLLALRGGYFHETSGPSYWSWGAGLRFYFLHVNVARYTRALLPSWQFDTTFSWGIK